MGCNLCNSCRLSDRKSFCISSLSHFLTFSPAQHALTQACHATASSHCFPVYFMQSSRLRAGGTTSKQVRGAFSCQRCPSSTSSQRLAPSCLRSTFNLPTLSSTLAANRWCWTSACPTPPWPLIPNLRNLKAWKLGLRHMCAPGGQGV